VHLAYNGYKKSFQDNFIDKNRYNNLNNINEQIMFIQIIDKKIANIKAELAVMQTARSAYVGFLASELYK
ncbi:MAG: hypothetical protein RL154_431, partial [Pseudomonadota bacterium]